MISLNYKTFFHLHFNESLIYFVLSIYFLKSTNVHKIPGIIHRQIKIVGTEIPEL
jgi:hypothetical protein